MTYVMRRGVYRVRARIERDVGGLMTLWPESTAGGRQRNLGESSVNL